MRPLGEMSGIVLRVGGRRIVGGDISKLDVLDRDVLDVETNVVTGNGLGESLMVRDADFVDISKRLVSLEILSDPDQTLEGQLADQVLQNLRRFS